MRKTARRIDDLLKESGETPFALKDEADEITSMIDSLNGEYHRWKEREKRIRLVNYRMRLARMERFFLSVNTTIQLKLKSVSASDSA